MVRKATDALLETVPTLEVTRRAPGGYVKELAVGEGGLKTTSLLRIKDSRAERALDSDLFPQEEYIDLAAAWNPLDKDDGDRLWAGVPKTALKPVLITKMETALRSGPVFESVPPKQVERKEAQEAFRRRVKHVLAVVRRSSRERPGVNPVNPARVPALTSRTHKVVELYSTEDLERQCGKLGLEDVVRDTLRKVQGSEPRSAQFAHGRMDLVRDGEVLLFNDQSQAGDRIVVKTAGTAVLRDLAI
jgi:hypothetical protein